MLDPVSAPDVWRFHEPAAFADDSGYDVLALVREGLTAADVEAELRGIADRSEPTSFVPVVNDVTRWRLGDTYVQALWLLSGGVVLLLIVALVNAVSLLLNRTMSRAGEVGVRSAVGGSTGALASLFLIESVTLTALGLAAALLVSPGGRRGDRSDDAASAPRPRGRGRRREGARIHRGARTGGGPPVRARPDGVAQDRRASGPDHACWRRASARGRDLTGPQGARGAPGCARGVLVTGSAVTLRSFREVMAIDTGVDVARLAQFRVFLPEERYPTPGARREFWNRLMEALEALPGIEGVATSNSGLLRQGSLDLFPWHLEGEPAPESGAINYREAVSPPFFEVTGVPIVEGRRLRAGE